MLKKLEMNMKYYTIVSYRKLKIIDNNNNNIVNFDIVHK